MCSADLEKITTLTSKEKIMSKTRTRFEQPKALHIAVVIASYLPFIGIIWASDKQLKNKLYALWYWFISMVGGAITFTKLAVYFNWL